MSLTGGFDLQIAVPESIAARIVQGYWANFSMPRMIRSVGIPSDPDAIVTIHLDDYPDVRLLAHENAVEMRIGFRAGIIGAHHYSEGYGVISLLMTISRQSLITVSGDKQVTLSIVPSFDAQGHPTMSFKNVRNLSSSTLTDDIKPVLGAKFAQIGLESPLLPAITLPAETFLNTKIYSEYEVGSFLSIFANQKGKEAALPSSGWCLFDDKISLSINGPVVHDRINEKLAQMGLAPADLPKAIPGHAGTILHSISFTLNHNYILVAGVMEHSGVTASFNTRISLVCSAATLKVQAVYDTNVNLPWYIDFVDAFDAGIESAAEEAVNSAIGGLSTSALGDALPWTNVPGVPDELFVQVNYDGDVYEDTSGIALQGQPTISGVKQVPAAYLGHRLTREVHTPSCQYGGELLWGPNPSYAPPETFSSVNDAVACGYNGCAFCLPEQNVEPPAVVDVRIKIDLTIPPPDHNWSSEITVGLYRLGAATDPRPVVLYVPLVYHGGVIRCGRNRAGWYEPGGDVAPQYMPLNVNPGKWRVFVKRGSWFEKVDINAKAVAPKTTDNVVYAFFRYGKDGASTSVGEQPQFP